MRPDVPQWGLQLAQVVALRATCIRRSVGCVLLDSKGRVLSTGYNGRASGLAHCKTGLGQYPAACEGAQSPSGTNLDGCEAIHAEQNALLQCRDVDAIDLCCCTTAPCITCTKLLLNTGCTRIVFKESYSTSGKALWVAAGRFWTQG